MQSHDFFLVHGHVYYIVLGELANIVFNDKFIPNLADGYHQYLIEQNSEGITVQKAIKEKITAVQKDIIFFKLFLLFNTSFYYISNHKKSQSINTQIK